MLNQVQVCQPKVGIFNPQPAAQDELMVPCHLAYLAPQTYNNLVVGELFHHPSPSLPNLWTHAEPWALYTRSSPQS